MSKTSRSLKTQILLYLLLTAFVSSFLTEVIIIEKNRRSLIKILDQTAMAYAKGLASLVEIKQNGEAKIEFADEIMRDFSGKDPSAYFLIRRVVDDMEIGRSHSLEDEDVLLPDSLVQISPGKVQFWDDEIGDKKIRFIALCEYARSEEEDEEDLKATQKQNSSRLKDNEFFFIVGLDKEYIYKRLEGTIRATVPALAAGLVLMLSFVWIAVNHNLKPFEKLEKEVQSLSVSNMSSVTIPEVREIASMARTFNRMIGDLKEAFERERRFTSNIAHELRTPISEMRSLAEVALRYGADLDEQDRRNYEDILASAKEMQKTVINLLTLARCHSGQLNPQKDTVLLQPFLDSIWEEQAEEASARGITASGDVPSDLAVVIDKDLLAIVLQNLFSNAVNYAANRGRIEWKADTRGDSFSLSISNSVDDFSETDLPHLFEPFWRKDEIRSSGNDHSGLGLSLVQSLSEVLGLSVSARLTGPSFLTIHLSGKTNKPA